MDRLTNQISRQVELPGKGAAGLPVHQGHAGAEVVLAHHDVTFQVACPALLIYHLGVLVADLAADAKALFKEHPVSDLLWRYFFANQGICRAQC